MKTAFSMGDKTIIGLCAIVDAAAAMTICTGPETVRMCGASWIIVGLEMIIAFTAGTVPLAIALIAVGAAALIPKLRNIWWWAASAVVFSCLAVGVVSAAVQRYPNPVSFVNLHAIDPLHGGPSTAVIRVGRHLL